MAKKFRGCKTYIIKNKQYIAASTFQTKLSKRNIGNNISANILIEQK